MYSIVGIAIKNFKGKPMNDFSFAVRFFNIN